MTDDSYNTICILDALDLKDAVRLVGTSHGAVFEVKNKKASLKSCHREGSIKVLLRDVDAQDIKVNLDGGILSVICWVDNSEIFLGRSVRNDKIFVIKSGDYAWKFLA